MFFFILSIPWPYNFFEKRKQVCGAARFKRIARCYSTMAKNNYTTNQAINSSMGILDLLQDFSMLSPPA